MYRILRIVNRLNVGGPTFNVAYLSKYLPDKYQTKIVSGIIEPDEASSSYILDELGLSYTYIPAMHRKISLSNDTKSLKSLINIINEYKPDIIHTHAAKAGAIGRIAAILAKHKAKVIVHTYHGNIFDGYFSKFKSFVFILIERLLALFTTAIVSISPKQKRELTQKYKIAKDSKFHVIPLGFDLDKFTEAQAFSSKTIREEFNIPKGKVLVVITGRLAPIKNHAFLLDVIKYCKEHYNLQFTTLIVGDGELRDTLNQLCDTHGLSFNKTSLVSGSEEVIFTSWRKDIPQINQAADICVLCSLNEGTPVSIIEAMASGKPVLTTRVGGVEDFIEHEINGMIAELDVTDYAEKLKRMAEDPDFCNLLSKNAQSSVLRKFDYRRLVADMDHFYSKLLSK